MCVYVCVCMCLRARLCSHKSKGESITEVSNFKMPEGHNCIHESSGGPHHDPLIFFELCKNENWDFNCE